MTKSAFLKEVYRLTVPQIDYNGGHIFMKHMHQTNEMLRQRVISEKVDATTFNKNISEDEILDLIITALEKFSDELLDWINDPSDGGNYEAWIDAKRVIGRGYSKERWHEWDKGAYPCSELCVALVKVERKYDTTFKIVTAYPRYTDKDKNNFCN